MLLSRRQVMWFQLDITRTHFTYSVYKLLNINYSQWIVNGRGGTIAKLPRSLNLTLLDFYLGEYMKQKMYVFVIKSRE